MKKRLLIMYALTMALVLAVGSVFAADQEQIYGSQLMTQPERLEYRERLRNATTAEEREQVRKEHHEQMRERAKEQGVALPDEPSVGGGGMGAGNCPGGGKGKGPGMGHGGGRGR